MEIFIPSLMVGLKGHDHNSLMPNGVLQERPQVMTGKNHPSR